MKAKIHEFLKEDIGSGDITSELVIPVNAKAKGRIVCKEECVVAGLEEAAAVFREQGVKVVRTVTDGARVRKSQTVMEVAGPARAMLASERLALNLIMRMSGIATLTDSLVRRARKVNPGVRIAATRKTTPGFREFEKKAVVIGGGDPHRTGLFDAVLIKDNHIRMAGSVEEALKRAKKGSFTKKVEIEVQSLKDAKAAVLNGADIVMLDNFRPDDLVRTSRMLRKMRPDILIEASGGIRPETIEEFAKGADIISLGWLTHSVKSVDFSMDIQPV